MTEALEEFDVFQSQLESSTDLDGFESDSDEDEIAVDLQPYVDKLRDHRISKDNPQLQKSLRVCGNFVGSGGLLVEAGLTPSHIVATIFNILGQTIGVLEVMTKYTNVVHKCECFDNSCSNFILKFLKVGRTKFMLLRSHVGAEIALLSFLA
ncbi:hypothetical protein H5410_047716 [Solanum commersonii]|uniref:Uncharacterized protein n=1 Tax=Solanum commersonii TaxID=4109 RepID=A0A9J5XHX6_SOLCO|nr:hypothetical protein H5410_047716 [Solanum commersonii]